MLFCFLLFACAPDTEPASVPGDAPAPTESATPTADDTATTPPAPTGSTGSTAADTTEPPTGVTADTSPWTGAPTASPYITLSGPPPTNVLVLSIDTTRADRINSNGYTGSTTSPQIDALLAEGLALRAHRSCSAWTMASFLCFLTGTDQVSLGTWPDNNNHGAGVPPYEGDLPSLAVRLHDEGFATRLVYANSFLSSKFNMNQGHDEETKGGKADGVLAHALEALDDLAAEDRWLLHVHFNDPHTPYRPTEANQQPGTSCPIGDIEKDLKNLTRGWDDATTGEQAQCLDHLNMLYDAEIRDVDDAIASILAHVDALGERDETMVVFVTDHGEEFYEHEEWEHGHGLFQGLNRSTAGLIYPPRIAPAEHHGLTTHEDMLPTLLTALDLPLTGLETGRPVGAAGDEVVHGLVYRNELTVQSVTTPTHVLIHHWEGRTYLYDIVADPEQTTNLYTPDDPTAVALWKLLRPRVDDLASKVTDGSVPVGLP